MKYEILQIKSTIAESLELLDLLKTISEFNPVINNYIFGITFFDGLPNEKFSDSFTDFINNTNGPDFLLLNFQAVLEKFSEISQIFDLLLLVDKDNMKFKRYSTDEDKIMYKNIFLTIAYFDGGFWEISCHDKSILYILKTKFKNSEIRFI